MIGQTGITVSVCVLTYNHEDYIHQCLSSIFEQKTNFKIEILLHDDASTDGTVDIVKDFESRYPNIIKPIYQTVNQRSIYGGGMNPRFNYPRASGKYVALLEGDDYWTDPYKLQKQVDFMEANPSLSCCGHLTMTQYETTDIQGQSFMQLPNESGVLTKRAFMDVGCFHTSSVFARAQYLRNLPKEILKIFRDNPMKIWLLEHGDIKILPELMSTYRRNDRGVSENINVKKIYQIELATVVGLNKGIKGFYFKSAYLKSHWHRYYLSNEKGLGFSEKLSLFLKFLIPSFYMFPKNLKPIASALHKVFANS